MIHPLEATHYFCDVCQTLHPLWGSYCQMHATKKGSQ